MREVTFAFGRQARDYMVDLPPYARHLEDVGRMVEGQHTYAVLQDPAGNHYARNMGSATPSLVRVYPVSAGAGA